MNVESSNLINASPGTLPLEGSVSSSGPVDGSIAQIFGDTLKVQLQLLEGQSTDKAAMVSEVVTTFTPSAEPLKVQDIADLLGKDLPVSYKVEDVDDLHAALSVVTDSWKYLGADAKSFSGDAKVSELTIDQELPQQTNVEPAQIESTQVLESKPSDGLVIKKIQNTEDDTTQDVQQVITVSSSPEQGQVQAQISAQLQTQLPSSSVPSSENTDAELSSSVSQLSVNSKAKTPNELNPSKNNVLQAKDLTQDTEASGASFKVQLNGDDSKLTQQKSDLSIGANADTNVAATAVNGQFDKLPIEAKTEVPPLSRPLTHPEWNKDLGERIVWMNNRAMPAAEIKLNPQHLGPVSVRIDMNHDQASIVFTSQHAVVREALEASVPKLREMLNDQQISLVNVSVSQQSSSEQRNSQPQAFNQFEGESVPEGVDGVGNVDHNDNEQVVVSNGLLNMYA